MKKPCVSLFIAGVQKGGTTALHTKLRGHPQIVLSKRKEIHFFDEEKLDWEKPDYEVLHREFDFSKNPDAIFGEATPIYTYWPNSLRRIADYNPRAKLIVILRHPAYRALSAWKMERARSNETLSFRRAISWIGRLRVRLRRSGVHRVYSYVERGFYAPQIRNIERHFKRDQVLYLTSDMLWRDERAAIASICAFLNVDASYADTMENAEKYVVPVDSSHVDTPDQRLLTSLAKVFHDDIRETSELTGLGLQEWLTEDYREPMQRKG